MRGLSSALGVSEASLFTGVRGRGVSPKSVCSTLYKIARMGAEERRFLIPNTAGDPISLVVLYKHSTRRIPRVWGGLRSLPLCCVYATSPTLSTPSGSSLILKDAAAVLIGVGLHGVSRDNCPR